MQSQAHGGHAMSGAQSGHAQAQPQSPEPPPEPPPDAGPWQTPPGHGWPSIHGAPIALTTAGEEPVDSWSEASPFEAAPRAD